MADLLKEKEEVQEYLKNLGIEYRYSCYGEKNPEGCQLLADYLSQIDSNYATANKVLKDNCEIRNYGRSCSSYGQNLLMGKGCLKDISAALEYFSKACELDDATGCDYAGKMHCSFEPSLMKHYKADVNRGARYLEHGCNLKSTSQMFESTESCYAAAFLYAVGQKDDKFNKNEQKAIEFGTKACRLGHIGGCKLVSNIYKKQGNEEMSTKFLNKHNLLKKQLSDGIEIEMQRT